MRVTPSQRPNVPPTPRYDALLRNERLRENPLQSINVWGFYLFNLFYFAEVAYVVGGLDERISIFIGGYRLFAKGRMKKVVIIFI